MKYHTLHLLLFSAISILIFPQNRHTSNFTERNLNADLISNIDSDTIFFPINISNEWQYLRSDEDWDGSSYELIKLTAEKDTVIGNNIYYNFNWGLPDLIRYSESEKKLYTHWQDSDYVNINFNILNGQYQSFVNGQYRTVYAESGEDFILGRNRFYAGYLYLSTGWGYELLFAESIGLYYRREADTHSSSDYDIIAAILYDTSGKITDYTDHKKPAFQITPITEINSQNFNLEFKVLHPYTRILNGNPPPWHHGLDFIDSVKMYCFYANNDTIIPVSPYAPNHISQPVNNDFSVSIQLDTMLLKNGFAFYYKFWAKDKCIIPESTFSPDTGYYVCVWNQPSGINNQKNKDVSKFSLMQNYPNPFNPSTHITYSIPGEASLPGDRESGAKLVTLTIYNTLGQIIATLVNDYKTSGTYEINFDGSNLPSGVYLYRLSVANNNIIKKMILLR